MPIKVYFGPYKYTPVPELPADERFLWLRDFHLLRGFERDFWTNNALMLDAFGPEQVMLWEGDQWRPLPELVAELLPALDDDALAWMPTSQRALMCEMASEHRAARAAQAEGEQR